MNILHISSGTLKSGANKGAYNLHKNLIKKGVKSIFFSPEKIEKKNYNFNNFKYKFSLFFEKLIKLSYMNKTKNSFTSSYFGINIKDTNEYKKADIIHVHNLGKTFVNLNIFKDVNKKFVFSLRDMWFFTGGCHYSLDCKKYIQICNNCPSLNSKFNRDLSYKSQKRKLEIFNNNIYIIAVSYWIKNRFKESKIGNKKNKYDVSVIENIANFENFNINKSGKLFNKLKKEFGKKTKIIFGATNLETDYKGTSYLINCLQYLDRDKFGLIIFGNLWNKSEIKKLGIQTVFLGYIEKEKLLNEVYNSGDIFLMTSIQDAFPKTFVEAMFCGLPIVCFEKTSMAFYLKNKKNGYIAKYKSSKSLSEGINWISETNKIKLLKKNARNLAIKKFGPTNLTNKHINLYKKILKKKN
jgi:glycosyltransferase involved in cell wall biosynthesis